MELELPWLLAPDLPLNKQVNLTWSSITLDHKMTLGRGYIWMIVNLTLRWSSIIVSYLATRCLCLGVHLTIGQSDQSSNTFSHQMSLLGRVRLTFCEIASQPASCNWPANQPCAVSTCQTLGWLHSWWWENWGPDHIGPQARVPALPLDPLAGWPTWPRPDKWHKWALEPIIYCLHYLQGPFAVCIYVI